MKDPLARFFVKENIKKKHPIHFNDEQVMRRAFGWLYDHVRLYKTVDNKVILTMSPYRTALTEEDLDKYIKFLYPEPLYHEDANTYCFVYENLTEYKRAIRATEHWLEIK